MDPRSVRPTRRLTVLAAAGAAAAAVLAQTAGAGASGTRAASPTPLLSVISSIVRVCALPLPGHVACDALVAQRAGAAAASTPTGLGPRQIQAAYALPAATGAPTVAPTVAIVDAMDDPNAESDLAHYRSTYGLPACTTANGCFHKVNQSGAAGPYPAGDTGWAEEISLDLDTVSATCPGCKILLVEATSTTDTDLAAAENTAARFVPASISNSYGGSEASTQNASDPAYHHPGIAITVSAGDSGYGVEYPASSPYVTAVGGTTLTRDSSARGYTETVWDTSPGLLGLIGGEGTGSGCSAYEPKPTWQHDPGCPRRTVADVAAVADPATGLAVYDSYGQSGWLQVGGTSLSAPLVASVYALAGNTGSLDGAAFAYAHPGALYDVTSGSNGSCGGLLGLLGGGSSAYLCTAGPGYDGPTGLGTPHGTGAF